MSCSHPYRALTIINTDDSGYQCERYLAFVSKNDLNLPSENLECEFLAMDPVRVNIDLRPERRWRPLCRKFVNNVVYESVQGLTSNN